MAIFSRLFESRSDTISISDPALVELFGGRLTIAGVRMNENIAMQIGAVWQCIMILALNTGTLPLPPYKETLNGRDKDRRHSSWKVLNRKANPWMTAATFRMALMLHLALWQAHYSHIERDGAGRIKALWPLMPDRTRPVTKGADLVFETQLSDGTIRTLRSHEVLYIPGITLNGIEALPTIKMAREALGLLMAMQEYGGRFFSRGANPGGIITTDEELTKEQKQQLAIDVAQQVQTLAKAHDLLVLSNGAKFSQIGVNPQNAQLLESRRFQIEEVARWFNMPPHKLGLMDKGGASYASVEQMQIQFVTETLRPWLVIIEQAMNASLLTDEEQEFYTIEHVVEGLLRGDSRSRGEFYSKLFNVGGLTPNDIRRLENKNTFGPAGDVPLVPLNLIPLDQAIKLDPQQRAALMQAAAALAASGPASEAKPREGDTHDAE